MNPFEWVDPPSVEISPTSSIFVFNPSLRKEKEKRWLPQIGIWILLTDLFDSIGGSIGFFDIVCFWVCEVHLLRGRGAASGKEGSLFIF